jgi:hypothetical protein
VTFGVMGGGVDDVGGGVDAAGETPLGRVLGRLDAARRSGGQWIGRCPAHSDARPSLAIREGDDGRVLLHCHTGCTVEAIVAAMGLEMRDLYPARDQLSPRRPLGPSLREQAVARRAALRDELGEITAERIEITRATAGVADDATWDELRRLADRETAIHAELADEATP